MTDRPAAAPDPAPRGIRVPRTHVVMLAAVAGLALGPAIIYADRWTWSAADRHFAAQGPFGLWVALIAAQTMVWTLALPPIGGCFLGYWRARVEPARREVLPSALVVVALFALIVVVPQIDSPLPDVIPRHHVKLDVLNAIALLAALTAGMSIWLIRARLEALAGTARVTGQEIDAYLRLRSDLEWLLGFLALVIGLAVLASASLSRVAAAYKDAHPAAAADIPAQAIVVYGLVLSLVAALLFLPTYTTLRRTGFVLRDALEPRPDPLDERFADQLERRGLLDDVLGLKFSASTSFRIGAVLLTPLFASLTSLVPTVGG